MDLVCSIMEPASVRGLKNIGPRLSRAYKVANQEIVDQARVSAWRLITFLFNKVAWSGYVDVCDFELPDKMVSVRPELEELRSKWLENGEQPDRFNHLLRVLQDLATHAFIALRHVEEELQRSLAPAYEELRQLHVDDLYLDDGMVVKVED